MAGSNSLCYDWYHDAVDHKISNRGMWKCETKLCPESRRLRHKPVSSREGAVLPPSVTAGKKAGRRGRQSAA